MVIVGINAYHGDASVAVVRDGQLVAAIEEERLSRVKHAAGFPALALREALRVTGVKAGEIDHVAVSRDPRANLHRKILFAAQRRPSFSKLIRDRLANVARVRRVDEAVAEALGAARAELRARFHNVEHHRAHIASAFYPSGFERAACLSIDGFGDFLSSMRATGAGSRIEVLDRVEFPHSAGLYYTAITQFLGFHKYGEEWKMMGLAPYGEPRYVDQLRQVIRPTPGGRFELDLSYFRHHDEGVEMTWDEGAPQLGRVWSDRLVELLGPARAPEDPDFFGKWADIARSAQQVYEEIFFHVLDDLQARTQATDLCLAGGCALNSSANGKIFERTRFRRVFAQAAAGDDGTAVGAALYVAHQVLGGERGPAMTHAYLGPSYSDEEIGDFIERARKDPAFGPDLSVRAVDDRTLFETAAGAIAAGKVVGWFQGAMEFGPRALGARSIVADPRRADMKEILNTRIKHRETYRPFAPSVLEERQHDYFERDEASPFMLMVYKVRPERRSEIPAITHVDGTGRLQTVSGPASPRYHALIEEFQRQTGTGLVLNTSFNEHEPVVCTPGDALSCFLRTRMDLLAMGNWVISRDPKGA